MSKGLPVCTESFQRAVTSANTAGSCTRCQPSPSICSGVVPVYSYQRSLYQTIPPSGRAIQASCGIESASVRNCSSLSCSAASARRRSEMSRVILEMPITVPSAVRIGAASEKTSTAEPSLQRRTVSSHKLSPARTAAMVRASTIAAVIQHHRERRLADRLLVCSRRIPRPPGSRSGWCRPATGFRSRRPKIHHRGQMGVGHLGLLALVDVEHEADRVLRRAAGIAHRDAADLDPKRYARPCG